MLSGNEFRHKKLSKLLCYAFHEVVSILLENDADDSKMRRS